MKTQNTENEIVLYQIDNLQKIEVVVKNDTVWLNRQQLALLFCRDVKTIGKHINNALKEELKNIPTIAKFATVQMEGQRLVSRELDYYNLDMILSIGYRVKSDRGIMFRRWANEILKHVLYQGHYIANRIEQLENRMDKSEQQIGQLLHAALPPKQGVFFEGQIFDAYQFVADLVRSTKSSIVLIDNYVNDSVLTLLDKRAANVTATIGVNKITPGLQLDLQRHNAQYPPIAAREIAAIHDRFLLVDGQRLYTFGASFKDLGKKLFCFSLLESEELVCAVGAMLQGGAGL